MDIENVIRTVLGQQPKKGVAGIWADEHKIVEAARRVHNMGIKDFETISPFPLHGIDDAMGIPRSSIPWVTFTFGLAGCTFGVWFTWWTSVVDWPLIIGGKPMWSLAAFIPVIFECTILFAALSSVAALLFRCGLPRVNPPVIDPTLTSHRFAIFVPEKAGGYDAEKLEKTFREMGASEVRRTEF